MELGTYQRYRQRKRWGVEQYPLQKRGPKSFIPYIEHLGNLGYDPDQILDWMDQQGIEHDKSRLDVQKSLTYLISKGRVKKIQKSS